MMLQQRAKTSSDAPSAIESNPPVATTNDKSTEIKGVGSVMVKAVIIP